MKNPTVILEAILETKIAKFVDSISRNYGVKNYGQYNTKRERDIYHRPQRSLYVWKFYLELGLLVGPPFQEDLYGICVAINSSQIKSGSPILSMRQPYIMSNSCKTNNEKVPPGELFLFPLG
jgi:hypothetical protein